MQFLHLLYFSQDPQNKAQLFPYVGITCLSFYRDWLCSLGSMETKFCVYNSEEYIRLQQMVSRRFLTTEVLVRSVVRPCGIYGRQSNIGTGFSPSSSVSPVSIIPTMLHTHSYIYHQRCIMFFSQYFSFPCQYHSNNAPYSFIHLSPTLYNVSLPVLQFPLSVSFHQCSIHTYIYHRRYIILVTENVVK
jgi:hypothetical protein